MKNKELINRGKKRHYTRVTVFALLDIALEKEGEKKWYIESTVNTIFLISKMRKGKLEKYESENYYLFW